MKQQEVFKKIGTILKELNDQYHYLTENESELNDLELELFVANAHFLADHSEVLRKLNLNKPEPPKQLPAPEPRFFEPVVQQAPPPLVEIEPVKEEKKEVPAIAEKPKIDVPVPHIDLRGDDTGTDYSYVRQDEPPMIKHELKLEDIPHIEENDEEPEPDKMSHPIHHIPAIPKAESPKVEANPAPVIKEPLNPQVDVDEKEGMLTINQRISAQINANASRNTGHTTAQPISDLKQAITLNDKLLYIKDLFNGYNLAYSEALDILNRFTSFDEAENFLKTSYAAKNNWDAKPATTEKFYALLRRRYS
ncbi:MAG: hypothetical protein JST50_15380 [Bacteroidetes bacterium]|jgi:hypothetical protein|nr:hypothetical protein [Bacteroidota bacterium]